MEIRQNGVLVRELIVHCAAVPTGWVGHKSAFQVFAEINRWHVERGFRSFGYHGLIMPDGEFFAGRPFDQVGAHCKGHNVGTIGILLVERRRITHLDEFGEWFTEAQGDALRREVNGFPQIQKVSGHNDYAAKLCPGFKVVSADWL